MEAAACGHAFWREGFHGDKSDITGVFDVFWVRALAVVARVARGGQAGASPGRFHATKCLLRRQTESQRDFVHHRRLAREAALDMTTPHPQSLSPLRGEGSQWRRDPHLGRFGYERNML